MEDRDHGPHHLGDQALMGRMRLGDMEAFREFFARYEPMLNEIAGQQGSGRRQARVLVLEVLDDVAERIRSHRVGRIVSLAGYLANALRNRMLDERRHRLRRQRLELAAASELEGAGQAALLSACSAYTVRAARPLDAIEDTRDPMVHAFHRHVLDLLSPEEKQLLGWIGERVPQREIAEWIGSTHGATRARVHRLRARVIAEARAYLGRLARAEREHLERSCFTRGRIALVTGHPERRGSDG